MNFDDYKLKMNANASDVRFRGASSVNDRKRAKWTLSILLADVSSSYRHRAVGLRLAMLAARSGRLLRDAADR